VFAKEAANVEDDDVVLDLSLFWLVTSVFTFNIISKIGKPVSILS